MPVPVPVSVRQRVVPESWYWTTGSAWAGAEHSVVTAAAVAAIAKILFPMRQSLAAITDR
ncbi:hypothetical protein ADL03_42215 [Nocardia sp. NRRL S-836]|nr:hypothetical protein ADL03_42215 [Nocardia sp. NRRL S-836]